MVRASRRGGVPVLSRPTGSFISRSRAASVMDGRIACTPGLVVVQPDMDQAGKESPGGQHDGPRAELNPELGGDPGGTITLEQDVVDRLLEEPEVWLVLQAAADRLPIEGAVGLRAGGANRGPLRGVQGAKLDAGLVRGDGHRAVQRIDFLDQVALADAADRRVAGHLAERLDAMGQQQGPAAQPRRSERGFGPGMAAADDDDVEFGGEQHGVANFTRTFHVELQRRVAFHVEQLFMLRRSKHDLAAALRGAFRASARFGATSPFRCSAACRSVSPASRFCCWCRRAAALSRAAALLPLATSSGSPPWRRSSGAPSTAIGPRRILLASGVLFPAALIALVICRERKARPHRTRVCRRRGRDLSANHGLRAHLFPPAAGRRSPARGGVFGRVGADRAHLHRRPDARRAVRRLCVAASSLVRRRLRARRQRCSSSARLRCATGASRRAVAQPARSARGTRFSCARRRGAVLPSGVRLPRDRRYRVCGRSAAMPALAGVLLGVTSAGSALGGLAYGSRAWHFPLARQFVVALALMAAGTRGARAGLAAVAVRALVPRSPESRWRRR